MDFDVGDSFTGGLRTRISFLDSIEHLLSSLLFEFRNLRPRNANASLQDAEPISPTRESAKRTPPTTITAKMIKITPKAET